jgi:hypothetical protein
MGTPAIQLLVASFILAGCAATTVEVTGERLKEPLCTAGGASIRTAIYWGTRWRADQKEPLLREAAALRGIEDFVAGTKCLSDVTIQRLTPEQVTAPDAEALRMAATLNPAPARVVTVVVRELGPRLVIGIPAIVEGGTEVLIDVGVLDATTSRSLATTRTRWRNGGTFVVKGVGTLDQDMGAALRSTLMHEAGQ